VGVHRYDVERLGSRRYPRDARLSRQFSTLKLHDNNRDTIWAFDLNGTTITHQLDTTWSDSGALAMTEKESGCDTGYGHFKDLKNCIAGGCDTYYDYLNLGCRYDSIANYKYRQSGSKEFYTEEGDAAC
jgi:hypothetical protein